MGWPSWSEIIHTGLSLGLDVHQVLAELCVVLGTRALLPAVVPRVTETPAAG
jgi:hypothetical protein